MTTTASNGAVLTTHAQYPQPPTRDVAHLGPILPACPVCGSLQYWHNHTTDVWECWGCGAPYSPWSAGAAAAAYPERRSR
jgi:hypothetical protein